MARIRTIKPELLRHEGLFEAERASGLPLRLAFAGLFTTADREGRFKWRPRELKLDVLPYDEVDFSKVLEALRVGGFVGRYEVDGAVYGYIPSWGRHQHINNREAPSALPAPPDLAGAARMVDATLTRASRVDDACGTPLEQDQGEGKGMEGKGKEEESFALVGEADQVPEEKGRIACPYDKVVALYHERLPGLPRVLLKSDSRQKALRGFWMWVLSSRKSDGTPRATSATEALEWIGGYFDRAAENDFLMGRHERKGAHANWRCDLDFLLTEKGKKHVIEKTGAPA